MLQEIIKDKIKIAMKEKDDVSKNILRLVLGETQQKNNITENDIISIIRKLIKSNEETISFLVAELELFVDIDLYLPENYNDMQRSFDNHNAINILNKEISILNDLLPAFLTEEKIKSIIAEENLDLLEFENEGKAVGTVIKLLKSKNSIFNTDLVKKIVQDLRA